MTNAVWRTPGPDAGRDIEGQVSVVDMSENVSIERWYVECKRYSGSLDWPTVHGKAAYAENHGADFLLFATTGTLSPRCKEEVSRRETTRARPLIRVWDAAVLENMVARHPLLMVKYGFAADSIGVGNALLPLVTVTTKIVQAAYGNSLSGPRIDPGLELAAALVDLISARLAGLTAIGGNVPRRLIMERDIYEWCDLSDGQDLQKYDGYGLRAVLAGVRFFSGSRRVAIRALGEERIEIKPGDQKVMPGSAQAFQEFLKVVGLWSNLEMGVESGSVLVSSRLEDSQ
jgi:hypothetical protein